MYHDSPQSNSHFTYWAEELILKSDFEWLVSFFVSVCLCMHETNPRYGFHINYACFESIVRTWIFF